MAEVANPGPESVISENYLFIKHGNKMKSVSGDAGGILICTENKWNSGYGDGISIDGNKIEIAIKINRLSIAYGCVIGIVSDTKYTNDYFHYNKFDVLSYALKSDSSQFCKGKKIGKTAKKFKTGDVVKVIIENYTIQWFINDKFQCVQNNIDQNVECWYLGVAMVGKKNDCVEVVSFKSMNENAEKQ